MNQEPRADVPYGTSAVCHLFDALCFEGEALSTDPARAADNGLCLCESPDGTAKCALPKAHSEELHQSERPVLRWIQLSAEEAELFDGYVGDWVTVDPEDGEEAIVVAYWPRRADDVRDGVLADRTAEWKRSHGV